MADTKSDLDAFRSFFEGAELVGVMDRFVAEDIDLGMLTDMADDDLKELGLSMGQRKKFKSALARLAAERKAVAAKIPAERRQLTVLFCDLVGSTNLATLLDPEDMRDVIAAYLRTSIGVMEAHGGHLAYTQGDGLMVYFGYPVAQEDDAANAVRAAIATLSAIQGLSTAAPKLLNVRLGIATGLVVVGDMASETTTPQDFVVGETPNLAARLQTLAEPGEVIISGETKMLAGGAFEYEARGYVELKGFSEPRPVFRPIAENVNAMRFDVHGADGMLPMVGREAELETLLRLWDEVETGKGRVVTVGAPAGMGKSRLVRSLTQRVGRPVVEMQCAPHLANRSLHPLIQELHSKVGIDRAASEEDKVASLSKMIAGLEALTAEDLPYFSDLVGVPAPGLFAMDANTRARLTRAVLIRRLIGLAHEAGPYILVLEDGHWADPSTQLLLDELVASISDVPVLLVISHRPEYVVPEEVKQACEQIVLAPLDHAPIRAIIEKVVGNRSFPAIMVRKIIEKTDGVPLFVEELTKMILDAIPQTGAITADMLEAVNIPATLQDSLMSRLDRMGPAKEIAQLGASIGRTFSASMVAAIASEGTNVGQALEKLCEAGLLHPDRDQGEDGYIFNHALVQDTAYNSLLRSRRQEIHLDLAKAILAGHEAFGVQDPEIIARHCDIGGLREEAMQYWVAAGQHAVGRAANVAAITYMKSALRQLVTLPETPERDKTELGIQMALAPAYMAIYGWAASEVEESAKRAQALAHSLGDGQSMFGATWGLWTNYFLRGDLIPAMETAYALKTMADLAPPGMPSVAAYHALSYTHYFRGEMKEAYDAVTEGLKQQSLELDQVMLPIFQLGSGNAMYSIACNIYWMLGKTDEAYAMRQAGIDRGYALNHPPSLVQAMSVSTMYLLNERDWEMLEDTQRRAIQISDEESFLYFKPMNQIYLAVMAACRDGDMDALKLADDVVGMVKSTGAFLTLDLVEVALAEALVENGRPEEALAAVDRFGPEADARHERVCRPEILRVRGLALAALGQVDAACVSFEEACDVARKNGCVRYLERAEACIERIREGA